MDLENVKFFRKAKHIPPSFGHHLSHSAYKPLPPALELWDPGLGSVLCKINLDDSVCYFCLWPCDIDCLGWQVLVPKDHVLFNYHFLK